MIRKKALDISALANLGHIDVSSVLPALKHVGSSIASHINPDTFTTVAKHMGSGTAAHILSNAALKRFRATAGNRALQSLGELGVKHGIEGKQIHPFLLDRVKQVVGPEPLAEYTGARNLLSKARGKLPSGVLSQSNMELASKPINGLPSTPAQMGMHIGEEVAKKKFNLSSDTKLKNFPVLGNVQKATSSFMNNGGKMTIHEGIGGRLINGAMNWLDKAKVSETHNTGLANRKVRDVANAAVVGATFPIPGLGDHILVNTARDTATRMPMGHGWVKGRVMQGLNADKAVPFFGKFGPKVVEGQGVLGKARRAMGDYLYSPTAWGEARDFGVKARNAGFDHESIKKVTPMLNDFM